MAEWDAIVVGAGPAGAAAALTLARGGVRVALLDREDFPRDKPCGDLLGRAAVAWCARLGIDLEALDAVRVRGVALRTPGGALVRGIARSGARAPAEAALVPRLRFDAALVEMAVAAGATLHRLRATAPLLDGSGQVIGVATRAITSPAGLDPLAPPSTGIDRGAPRAESMPATPPIATGVGPAMRATTVPGGPELIAPLVVAADGWGSAIARALLGQWAARPAQRGIAARCYVEGVRGLHGRMRFYCERDLMPGCAWIFPLDGDRANVGLGTLVRDDAPPARLAERLERFIADPASPAADILGGARRLSATASWPLAIGWRHGPLAFDGLLLAGDAAALVSPMSGSGIAAALHSGHRAGRAGLRALDRGDTSRAALLPYERHMRRAFQTRYALERGGQALVASPARLDLVGALAAGMPYGQALAAGLLFNLG